MKRNLSRNSGFTLIELIVVIVILGIMAAIAGPKFVDLQSDARESVLKGMEGALRSSATLVYSKALIEGQDGATGTLADGTTLIFGYPDLNATTGIVSTIDFSTGDFTHASGVFTLQTNCEVTYTVATATAAPGVTSTVSGC